MMPYLLTRSLNKSATVFLLIVAAVGILVPLSNLLLPASSPFQVPTYLMALFGKYLCYAILALSIDLIWGYCGILSLGHGAFFALGAYFALSLSRQFGWAAIWLAPVLTGLVGIVVEFVLIRRLYGKEPLLGLILTFALALHGRLQAAV